MPFLAAFDDRQADVLVYAGVSYIVEESQSGFATRARSCCGRPDRALALAET